MTDPMNPKTTPAEALGQAMREVLAGRGEASEETAQAWSAELTLRLTEIGFTVAKDYHHLRDEHPASCYHCGRPENTDPFVVPGTPLELRSSEGDAGRFRHWGGDDLWICQAHPNFLDRDEGSNWDRTMEGYEAVEHLAARDGITDPIHRPLHEIEAEKAAYAAAHTKRLIALDAQSPQGGHQGVARQRAGTTKEKEPASQG